MQEDILLFREETFQNGKEQSDLPTQDATYGLYIYICVCVCISWCQIGLTPAVHAQNQCAKYELLHTRKSFDCFFYDNSIKMDRIYIHYLYKLHISFFFPPPTRDRNFKNK